MPSNKSAFIIRITSEDESAKIRPDLMRAKDLAKLITTFDEVFSSLVKEQMGDDLGGLSIVKIAKGSVALHFEGQSAYTNALVAIGNFLTEAKPVPSSIKAKLTNAKKEIELLNSKYNTIIELKKDSKSEPVATIKQAIISPTHEPCEISGFTTIYGKVIGISGTESIKAKLKLLSGETIEINIKSSQVKEFGKRYNEIIGIDGKATWEESTNKIIKFEPTNILSYTESTPKEAFSSIKEKFSDIFDEIPDVMKFVAEQRGDY